MPQSLAASPRAQVVLPSLYRSAMRITRKHGMRTLSRINHQAFPAGQVIRLTPGADFFVPPDPHFFGYIVEHEQHVADLIDDLVEEGDTCVDVGANIGYFTARMAARAGASGLVLAFEPEPGNFALLSRNVQLAQARGYRVVARQVAISERPGELELVRGEESTLHQVRELDGTASDVLERVPCAPLGAELAAAGAGGLVKLLKIDVEGHETAVLRGCLDDLKRGTVAALVIEVTDGEPAAEVADLLRGVASSTACWLEGAWRERPIETIPYRTDVLVKF